MENTRQNVAIETADGGVPQGSILGSFFIRYKNHLQIYLHPLMSGLYGDDTNSAITDIDSEKSLLQFVETQLLLTIILSQHATVN